MRIGDKKCSGEPDTVQTGPAAASRSIGEAAVRTSRAKKTGPPSDRVELSKVSGKMAENLSAEQAARAARLGRIAAEVESGNYRVDPREVARSIVDEATTGEKNSSGGGT